MNGQKVALKVTNETLYIPSRLEIINGHVTQKRTNHQEGLFPSLDPRRLRYLEPSYDCV